MSSRMSGTAITSERRRTWTSKGAGQPDEERSVPRSPAPSHSA